MPLTSAAVKPDDFSVSRFTAARSGAKSVRNPAGIQPRMPHGGYGVTLSDSTIDAVPTNSCAVGPSEAERRAETWAESLTYLAVRTPTHKAPILTHAISLQFPTVSGEWSGMEEKSSTLRGFLNSQLMEMQQYDYASESIENKLTSWLSVSVLRNLPLTREELRREGRNSVILEYRAILEEILEPCGFSGSESYEDRFGGSVLDFFREADRVSCIISDSNIQLLSYIDNTFNGIVIERGAIAKLEAIEFVEQLFASKR